VFFFGQEMCELAANGKNSEWGRGGLATCVCNANEHDPLRLFLRCCAYAVLNILCLTYFLTSVVMPDIQSCSMRHISVNDVSAPSGISSLSKLWIPFLNHLLDGDLCDKFLWFPYFSFFWFSIMILSYILILPMFQLQTQQLMTLQIRSHRIFNTNL